MGRQPPNAGIRRPGVSGVVGGVLAVVGLMLVVLTAGTMGTLPHDPEPRARIDTRAPEPTAPIAPAKTTSPTPVTTPATVEVSPTDVAAGLILALAALVGWAISRRGLGRAGSGRGRRPVVSGHDMPGGTAMRHAAVESLAALRRADRGDTHDEVIACWVRLEDAAASVGVARGPAQTPSQFTASMLAARSADPAAVEALLRLYHQARFGSRALPAGAIPAAQAALSRIAATLSTERARAERGAGGA